MIMSLEEQMVDRWLFSDWSDAEVSNVSQIPLKTGWSPLPMGFLEFFHTFPEAHAIDFSAFDWTIHGDLIDEVIKCRLDQCSRLDDVYQRMVHHRIRQVFQKSVFRLPDGTRYQQAFSGFMKSGWFRTINENSACSFLAICLAYYRAFNSTDVPDVWTMGDDVIMRWNRPHDDLKQLGLQLSTLGLKLKHCKEAFEFAGFEMRGSCLHDARINPLYPDKHQFGIHFVPDDLIVEVSNSYSLIYSLADSSVKELIRPYIAHTTQISEHLASAWARGLLRIGKHIKLAW